MSWKQRVVDILRDVLRFCVSMCIIIDGILLATFSCWLCWKLVWHTRDLLTRAWFSRPW